LSLFFRNLQIESHKPWGYWRLIWSLTSEPIRLVEVHVNSPGYPC
jgi:hypothetical protein